MDHIRNDWAGVRDRMKAINSHWEKMFDTSMSKELVDYRKNASVKGVGPYHDRPGYDEFRGYNPNGEPWTWEVQVGRLLPQRQD